MDRILLPVWWFAPAWDRPMPLNVGQFFEAITKYGLVGDADAASILPALGEIQTTAEAEAGIREAVRRRVLTKFQAANLYQGRGKGLIFGEYVVLDKLGEGGMGQVYKAQHRRMKRTVALKVLPPHAMG